MEIWSLNSYAIHQKNTKGFDSKWTQSKRALKTRTPGKKGRILNCAISDKFYSVSQELVIVPKVMPNHVCTDSQVSHHDEMREGKE